MSQGDFASEREAALTAEATEWDTTSVVDAMVDDIPVVDVGDYFHTGDADELERLGATVRHVGEKVGFHFLTGHGIGEDMFAAMFAQAAAFLNANEETKRAIEIDHPDAAVAGIGYLPLRARRLPTRDRGNLNEAVLFKRDRSHRFEHNMWPDEAVVPDFRTTVSRYAAEIERVALGLLPVYARALDLPADWFDSGFTDPFFRLRMTRYARTNTAEPQDFGIAPHVDTTFFTLLAQSSPGLVIFSEAKKQWLRAPVVPGALVVNTGELLKQWSNDRFVSVKHFVPPNTGVVDRYSVPFFFNATADHPMACLPTCTSADNPPRYPTVSYLESQAVAQRE